MQTSSFYQNSVFPATVYFPLFGLQETSLSLAFGKVATFFECFLPF